MHLDVIPRRVRKAHCHVQQLEATRNFAHATRRKQEEGNYFESCLNNMCLDSAYPVMLASCAQMSLIVWANGSGRGAERVILGPSVVW